MDAISAAFASLMSMVSASVADHLTDDWGLELKAVEVMHQDVQVPYAYQRWRIRPDSVCSRYKSSIGEFSRCTVAAKSLFTETCAHLERDKDAGLQVVRLKNMYCDAARSYQPTIASVTRARAETPFEQARAACNLAIAEAYGSADPALRKRKEAACGKYKALKDRP